jgi:hypothetical protein
VGVDGLYRRKGIEIFWRIFFDMTVKMSEEEYFRRAKEKRGDTDYSGSVYNGMREKMNFRCIEHDIEFNQRIDVHLSGSVGCPKCQHSFDMVAFEKDSRKKNGDNLDYSECVYIRYGHKNDISLYKT